MLYNLAVKNFKRYRVIHGIQISIGALAVMIMFDFSLMGADAKLMQVIGNTILSRSFLFLFTLVVAGLLILFSTYWNRLLMRQRYQEIGQLALMGMPTLKILLAFAIEFLLSQIIALGIGLCLGLLFYKLLVMILLKVSYVNFAIGFYFNWRALLPVILLIPILQVILFLNNLITIKRLSLLRLLKPKRPNVPEILPLWQLQLLSLLVLGLLLGGAQGFVNLFSVDDFLAQQLNISLVAGLCLAILLLSIAWILGLMGLWRIVIPTVILCLRRFKKLYFIQQRIFTISEISRWSFRNVKSLTGITLLLGLAFTFLGMGALVSRYGLNTIDNYTPYSLLATANKQVEIDQILKRDKVVAQVQPIFQTKILPVNYNLDTVVGHNYRSNADPSMVMTQATYNRFARYRGLKTLKLKPNQAGIIMPVTSILKAASKKDIAAQKPVVQVGTYAQLKLQITSITNQFPLGENAAFQIAIIVNPQDYAKLNEGLSQNYVAYDIFEPLSNKTLLSIEKLNQDAYIHLSAGHLVHRGQGTAKERTFVQEQVFVRQLQKAHIQKLIGFGMFIGVLVSLVVVVAMGAILMLKRLMVAAELHDDYQTLIKIGRNPTDLRHSIIWAHIFIFASLLLLGLLQALIVANTFRLLVNNPNFQLLYLVTGICILIYGLIGALTTAIYLRAVDL